MSSPACSALAKAYKCVFQRICAFYKCWENQNLRFSRRVFVTGLLVFDLFHQIDHGVLEKRPEPLDQVR